MDGLGPSRRKLLISAGLLLLAPLAGCRPRAPGAAKKNGKSSKKAPGMLPRMRAALKELELPAPQRKKAEAILDATGERLRSIRAGTGTKREKREKTSRVFDETWAGLRKALPESKVAEMERLTRARKK